MEYLIIISVVIIAVLLLARTFYKNIKSGGCSGCSCGDSCNKNTNKK